MFYFCKDDLFSSQWPDQLPCRQPSVHTKRNIFLFRNWNQRYSGFVSLYVCSLDEQQPEGQLNHSHAKKFNSSRPSDAYMRVWTWSSLFQKMECPLFGAKTLTEPMMTFCELDPTEQTLMTIKRLVCVKEHYNDVIMGAVSSQITGVSIVCSIVCLGADQRKYQISASLVFVRGFQRWPRDSLHKGRITRKVFPFDDVIMICVLYASYATSQH